MAIALSVYFDLSKTIINDVKDAKIFSKKIAI